MRPAPEVFGPPFHPLPARVVDVSAKAALQKRFPDAKCFGASKVVTLQKQRCGADDATARKRFGANAAFPSVPFEALDTDKILLKGCETHRMLFNPRMNTVAKLLPRAFWRNCMCGLDKMSMSQSARAISGERTGGDQDRTGTFKDADRCWRRRHARPLPEARAMHEAIAGSTLIIVPESGHSSPVEAPQTVTDAMPDFPG